jgi:hypothetical protein
MNSDNSGDIRQLPRATRSIERKTNDTIAQGTQTLRLRLRSPASLLEGICRTRWPRQVDARITSPIIEVFADRRPIAS